MRKSTCAAIAGSLLLLGSLLLRAQDPAPVFSSVFGSNMVLPHSEALTLRGYAPPGTALTLDVAFADQNLADGAQYSFESQSRQSATFVLGKIDEVDTTWINGRFVNNTFGYGTRREYALEPGVLQAGRPGATRARPASRRAARGRACRASPVCSTA